MINPFWKYPTQLRPSDIGVHWVFCHLVERSFETKETVTRYYNAGALAKSVKVDDVIAKIKSLGGTVTKRHHPNRHTNPDWFCTWDNGGVEIEYWPKNRGITLTFISVDETVYANELREYFDSIITRQQTKGRVYVVVMGQQGPKLTEMGVAGEEFIPSNYRPETVDQYRHVIEDLNKTDPCGRIILLDGQPGTGKTHMVRAMLNEVPKATFILVPSNFISSLGDPAFLGLLVREQKKDGPLVLILEDSDEALVNRKEGNASAISALLNFSDGIFGTLLDMRLVCTTNVEIQNLDPAVVRDGRLCTRMEVGLLDTDMANTIYERLTGKKGELKEKLYKLGTVYKIAKGNNSDSIERAAGKPKHKLGFLPEPSVADAARSLLKEMTGPKSKFESVQNLRDALTDVAKQIIDEEEPKEDVPVGSPAHDLGLKPGDEGVTDDGMKFTVDVKGQLHADQNGPHPNPIKEFLNTVQDPNASDGDKDRAADKALEAFVDEIVAGEGFTGEPGEVITAVVNGELVEVGYIDSEGNLNITDDSFADKFMSTKPDDDSDLIDEDPDDDEPTVEFDANVAPEYIDKDDYAESEQEPELEPDTDQDKGED